MEIGETLEFPKDMRSKINGVLSKLYCHGKYFISRTDKEKML